MACQWVEKWLCNCDTISLYFHFNFFRFSIHILYFCASYFFVLFVLGKCFRYVRCVCLCMLSIRRVPAEFMLDENGMCTRATVHSSNYGKWKWFRWVREFGRKVRRKRTSVKKKDRQRERGKATDSEGINKMKIVRSLIKSSKPLDHIMMKRERKNTHT